MTDAPDDIARLRRHLRALATVNRQLKAQLEYAEGNRRAALAGPWIDALRRHGVASSVELVRRADGRLHVVEDHLRRDVRAGMLIAPLEAHLGTARPVADDEIDDLDEGPPVEVLEGPHGLPFLVIGGTRLPLRDLPLPHPVDLEVMLSFPEGAELSMRGQRGEEAAAAVSSAAVRNDRRGLPTFIIIGAQKAATRWLRANLDTHPDIYTAPGEPGFFNDEQRYKNRGLEWYREQFAGRSGERLLGESTPGYMMWHHRPEVVAERIHRATPDVRLVALLRNPVDRAESAMVHHIIKGRLPSESNLVELATRVPPDQDQLGLVAGGWYAASLEPYVRLFGEQLLVLLHDDVVADPEGVYRRVLRHIGADPSFVPPDIGQVVNSQRALANQVEPLDAEARLALWPFFEDDVARLEQLLGRNLASWRPVAAPAGRLPAIDTGTEADHTGPADAEHEPAGSPDTMPPPGDGADEPAEAAAEAAADGPAEEPADGATAVDREPVA